MKSLFKWSALGTSVLAAAQLSVSTAHAAGFEKSIFWGAEEVSRAGAVSSSTRDANSLYYNPAGLAHAGKGYSLNVSPHQSEVKGPVAESDATITSEKGYPPIGAVFYSHPMGDNVTVGGGLYASGGINNEFENVDYNGVNSNDYSSLKPTVKSELSVLELSLGAGMKVNSNLSVGLAWRAAMIRGELESAGLASISGQQWLQSSSIKNIEDERFNGFRLGLQYEGDAKNWGWGLSWRSPIKVKGKGDSTGKVLPSNATAAGILQNNVYNGLNFTAGTITDVPSERVKVLNEFPHQLSLGGHYFFENNWKLFGELTYTNYKKNKELRIEGRTNYTSIAPNVAQGWANQMNYRVASEYTMGNQRFALGYVLTSQVTPDDHARSTFASPGLGHTVALGHGIQFDSSRLDVALENSFASGSGVQTASSSAGVDVSGKFESSAYAFHLTYKMDV